MHKREVKIVWTIVGTIVLLVLSFIFAEEFANYVFSFFTANSLQLHSTELFGQFEQDLEFVSAISMLPFLFFQVNSALRHEKTWKIRVSVAFVLLSGIGFMFGYIYYMLSEIVSMPHLPGIENAISVSSIHAGWYLGIGFLVGALVSTVLFLTISMRRKM